MAERSVGDKPKFEWRGGGFKVAVWEHTKDADGKQYTEYSMVLSKSYKQKDSRGHDEWHEQRITLFLDELPTLSLLLERVFGELKWQFTSTR
jgi:hypothetical protein